LVSAAIPLLNILCTDELNDLQNSKNMAGDKPVESVESVA
jgi:hypothetical protein